MNGKRRNKRKNKGRLKKIVVCFAVVILFAYLLISADAAIDFAVESGVRENISRSVNAAAEEILSDFSYSDFVAFYSSSDPSESLTVEEKQFFMGLPATSADYSRSGLYLNCAVIGAAGYKVAVLAENLYKDLSGGGGKLRLGALTGISSLALCGAELKVPLPESCKISFDFENEFAAVGINRSVHTLYFSFDCTVAVAGVFGAKLIAESFRLPVACCVIEGDIPDIILKY